MEIEKKFLVNKEELTTMDLRLYNVADVTQAYIGNTDDKEVRIRYIEDNYHKRSFMTIKSTGNLIRKEIEFQIPINDYRRLIAQKMYEGNIINKLRYRIPLYDCLVAELDIYNKELSGLIIVEVEFINEYIANEFKKPSWFGEEVTNDKRYKNKNLAINSHIND